MILYEDIDALKEVALGSHNAFRFIFMKYFPRVKYFIAHIVKSEDVAEDLSQDIFLKVWVLREMLPDLRSFNAYIYKMARNSALNHLEHTCVVKSFAAGSVSQSGMATPEEEFCAKEMELLIRITVDRMPEQRRKIYVMSRFEGIKNGRIAEILGLSEKTVNNQLSLALREIRSILMAAFLFFV